MTRIAFVGAGSVVFTKNLMTDTLSFPELRGAHHLRERRGYGPHHQPP